ncbi:uncharacterized protein LOC134197968 [Corticium candelabrum]|uniref:uncharacterized protein LOC134190407 n=1 Tax=Corticium candelabrum TaxID=121492 RepID=UPI002E254550|nr:uncharacterized protein LOC134190407 [Corticium candelabrum]XP_062519629.1 uncharacterized protein LOC134194700 [Corticium candelabrum]XP_062523306.1 uncharacterized protein LOC134197968 [Corticium candelabrum]
MDAMRWSKRKKQLERVEAMNEKRLKLRPSEEEGAPSEPACTAEADAETLDGDSDSVQSFSDDDVWSCLDEWVRALGIVDLKMLSLLLFEFHRRETSQTVKRAADVVSQIVHKNEGTIRDWRNNFRHVKIMFQSRLVLCKLDHVTNCIFLLSCLSLSVIHTASREKLKNVLLWIFNPVCLIAFGTLLNSNSACMKNDRARSETLSGAPLAVKLRINKQSRKSISAVLLHIMVTIFHRVLNHLRQYSYFS